MEYTKHSAQKSVLLIVMLIGFLLLLPIVSADWNIDNYKVHKDCGVNDKCNDNYGVIEVWDTGQIGDDTQLYKITLEENTEVCAGTCYAVGSIELSESGKIFDDMNFYDLYGGEKRNVDYEIYLKEYYDVKVPTYESSCYDLINGTESCEAIQTGERTAETYNLIKYNGEELESGTYDWIMYGYKQENIGVDWIGTIGGQSLEEWADWDGTKQLQYNDTLTSSTGWTPASATFDANGLHNPATAEKKHFDMNSINQTEYWFRSYHSGGGSYVHQFGFGFNESGVGIGITLDTNNLNIGGSGSIGGGGSATGFCTDATMAITGNHNNNWAYVIIQVDGNTVDAWIDFASFSNLDTGNTPNLTTTCNGINFTNDTVGFWYNNAFDGVIYKDLLIYHKPFLEVDYNYPVDDLSAIGLQVDLSCNISNNVNIDNATVYVYDSSNNLDYTNTITGISALNTQVNWTTSVLSGDTYNWSCSATDTSNNIESTVGNRSFNIDEITENSQSFNTSTYEMVPESFILNLSYNSTIYSSTTANLIYNGTSYAGTLSGGSGEAEFTRSLNIPLLATAGTPENRSFYWEIGLTNATTTVYANATTKYQNVDPIILDLCNATNDVPYINFTFKDESTLANINGSIDTSSWLYWLGDGSLSRSLLYINSSSDNPSYSFCFDPADKTYHVNRSLQYSFTGYPQRRHESQLDLTNTTTDQILYLLSSASGIYSTVQTVDGNGDVVTGVHVTAERQFSGVWTIIGEDDTDDAGQVTFFINPNFDIRLTFEKAGCTSITQTIRPSQSQYTASLQCGETVAGQIYVSPVDGIKYSRTPTSGIISDGEINFTFQVVSSKDNIAGVKFDIVNTSDSVILNTTSSNCTVSGCIISQYYTVKGGDDLKGKYYVDIGIGGLFVLESDAHWRYLNTTSSGGNWKDFWLNVRAVAGDEDNLQADFNRLVFIFFIGCIMLSFFNKFTGYDASNPGAFLTIVTFIVIAGSVVGGSTGRGFFYYNGLTPLPFLNNWILALIMLFMTVMHFINVNRGSLQ